MKGMRIFEINSDGVFELDDDGELAKVNLEDTPVNDYVNEAATDTVINIACRAVMEYTCKNEDKMMRYVMSFDVSQKDVIARDFIMVAVEFVLEYAKQISASIANFKDIDRLMANANKDLQEFLDQHIDKRFAEVY